MSYWTFIYRLAWTMLAVLLLTGSAFIFVPRYQELQELQRRETALLDQIRQKEEILRSLRIKQERFENDPEFVERIAHDIGMARPNEVIYRYSNE